jgi:peptidoglycan/xylan/chitin deacetylase (PgdA/CDA1 family)
LGSARPSRRGIYVAIAGVTFLLLVAAVAVWQVSRSRCFVLVGAVTCRVETARPLVALTFDDGPTPLGAGYALRELARSHARATFFLTGREAASRPDLVAAIVAGGHEVGNHSFSHRPMVGASMAHYQREIDRTQAALGRGGAASRTFRPPYGKKLVGLPLAVERAGLRMVTWDVEDPTTSDPVAFADRVVAAARPGSIILLHVMYPANDTARRALPAILSGLQHKGLRIVTVGELLVSAEAPDRTQRK